MAPVTTTISAIVSRAATTGHDSRPISHPARIAPRRTTHQGWSVSVVAISPKTPGSPDARDLPAGGDPYLAGGRR
jgi:hypothetical protein